MAMTRTLPVIILSSSPIQEPKTRGKRKERLKLPEINTAYPIKEKGESADKLINSNKKSELNGKLPKLLTVNPFSTREIMSNTSFFKRHMVTNGDVTSYKT